MRVEIPDEFLQQVINPFMLGADPEFAVLAPPDDHLVVNGVGGTPITFYITAGGLGRDHGGRVWEIRPTPSQSAYGIVTNIWKILMSRQLDPIEPYKWKAGAISVPGGETLGGHVHFGLGGLSNLQLVAMNRLTAILHLLDVLPMKESKLRHMDEPLRQSEFSVEYRMPDSWLDCPGQALACLTTYKLAAVEPASVPCSKSKNGFLEWVRMMAERDIDAWLLNRLIEKQGFIVVQATPGENFGPKWRRENPWEKR